MLGGALSIQVENMPENRFNPRPILWCDSKEIVFLDFQRIIGRTLGLFRKGTETPEEISIYLENVRKWKELLDTNFFGTRETIEYNYVWTPEECSVMKRNLEAVQKIPIVPVPMLYMEEAMLSLSERNLSISERRQRYVELSEGFGQNEKQRRPSMPKEYREKIDWFPAALQKFIDGLTFAVENKKFVRFGIKW
jgi:hypothetical protein